SVELSLAKFICARLPHRHPSRLAALAPQVDGQSNKLDTLSSDEVRRIASPIRLATESTRMLRATRTASVGWMESVMTSSFSFEAVMRATAPPESTPWLI